MTSLLAAADELYRIGIPIINSTKAQNTKGQNRTTEYCRLSCRVVVTRSRSPSRASYSTYCNCALACVACPNETSTADRNYDTAVRYFRVLPNRTVLLLAETRDKSAPVRPSTYVTKGIYLYSN